MSAHLPTPRFPAQPLSSTTSSCRRLLKGALLGGPKRRRLLAHRPWAHPQPASLPTWPWPPETLRGALVLPETQIRLPTGWSAVGLFPDPLPPSPMCQRWSLDAAGQRPSNCQAIQGSRWRQV